MKYDLTKEPTRGAMRTLNAFGNEMFALLSEKNFEDITVNEICDRTTYPRATFYNYFDDKYDLLNYCWLLLGKQIGLDNYQQMDPNQWLYVYFDRIYDLSMKNNSLIRQIFEKNTSSSYMFNSFRTYVKEQVRLISSNSPWAPKCKLPNEMVADHHSNTPILVFEWCIWKEPKCTKKQAHEYLRLLVGELNLC